MSLVHSVHQTPYAENAFELKMEVNDLVQVELLLKGVQEFIGTISNAFRNIMLYLKSKEIRNIH
jgi:hypothetical protein